MNPIEAIRNSKKHKASSQAFAAFSGPPKKHDPTHVKLREMGWAMAQRVFHPPDIWLTKDANAFINKKLIVVKDQKKELESHMQPDDFLREYKKRHGY